MRKTNVYIDDSFVLGGVNFYEDPHFSFFYLSQSLNVNTRNLYPGYSKIVALYIDGIERYYIKKDEAKMTAEWILSKLLTEQQWFLDILNEIKRLSSNLMSLRIDTEKQFSDAELLELYRGYYQLNIELYKVARIPEALDRGEPYFTNYLKNYLLEIGCNKSEIPILFDSLTQPKQESVFAEERRELDLIRQQTFSYYPNIQEHYSPLMLLEPKFRKSLTEHRRKWSTINYHGYRNPKLLSENDFLNRILFEKYTKHPKQSLPISTKKYQIDDNHKILFYIYSEIGNVKIYRRFCQLNAFYFLDNLISRISQHVNLSEIKIRYCLPDEIMGMLSGKDNIKEFESRATDKCGFYYNDNSIVSFNGDDLLKTLSNAINSKPVNNQEGIYYGNCVSLGKVSGRVKKIDEIYSTSKKIIPGDILVCQSLDPDFLPFLIQASGVITEQGGVTSHGAIICRELNIPTISGVSNILELVSDNDLIEIDAFNEFVRVIEKGDVHLGQILVSEDKIKNADVVGYKSLNLFLSNESGINVPKFHILSFDAVSELFFKDKNKLSNLIQSLCQRISPSLQSKFLIRSSCIFEDSPKHFYAGYFKSFLLYSDKPIEAITNFIEFNSRKNYQGSILLQEFINAEYCGVCMIGDINYSNSKHLVIEYSKGSINHATLGSSQISRFVYDITLEEFIGEKSVMNNASDNFQFDFVNWFKSIENKFSSPTYLEWGYKDNDFFLYQLRFKHK